jgi:arylsulfatase A-like enzyme
MLRIPLVVAGPGVPAGQRIGTQVSLLDLAPTILDWAGLPPLPTQRGRSLLRALDDREAYAETDHGVNDTRKLALRAGAGRWKAVLTFDRKTDDPLGEEWFDLGKDAAEARSSPPPDSAAAAIRARLLDRWRAARQQGAGGLPVDLTPEQIEQLRALGYVQ